MVPRKSDRNWFLIVFFVTILPFQQPLFAAQQSVSSSTNLDNINGTINGAEVSGSNSLTLTVPNTYGINTDYGTNGYLNAIDTSTAPYTGTDLTVTFNGSSSVYGDVGSSGVPVTVINAGAAGSTVTFNYFDSGGVEYGNVYATSLNLTGGGTVVIGGGAELCGNAYNTSGTANQGTITFNGWNYSGSGNIGTAGAPLSAINLKGPLGGGTSLQGTVYAQNINITTNGNNWFYGDVTGNINFTSGLSGSNSGGALFGNGASLIGNVTSSKADGGMFSLRSGTQSVSGTVGSALLPLHEVNGGQDGANSSFLGAVYSSILGVSGAGTVTLNADSTVGTTTVANGGALQLQNGITVTGSTSLTLSGTGISSGGALRNISGDNAWSGDITLSTASSRVNSDSGTLTLSGGTISGAGKNLIVGGAGGTLIGDVIGTTTGTLTYDGSGTLTLTGANTYSGGTALNSGTVIFGNDTALGTGSLSVAGSSAIQSNNDLRTIANNISLGTNNLTVSGGDDLTLTGIISSTYGSGTLIKTGTGTLTLSGANTYTGGADIREGTLQIGAGGILSGGNLSSFVGSGASLDLNGQTISTASEVLGIAGTGINNGGALRSDTGSGTWRGANIYLTGDARINNNSGSGDLTIGSVGTLQQLQLKTYGLTIGGAGDTIINEVITSTNNTGTLAYDGTGILTLSGANTYTGTTTISSGTLKAGVDNVAGTSGAFGNGAAVQLNNTDGGGIDLDDHTVVVGSLNGVSTSTVKLGSQTLTSGSLGTADTYAGVISGTGGLTINEAGSGSLTLTGANTYTGPTLVTAGTLYARNSNALGNGSAVTLINGTTLDVGTTDVIINDTYTQNAGSTLALTISGPSSSGKITSDHAASISQASNVNITVSGYIPANTTFTIVQAAAGAGVNVPGTITSNSRVLTFSGSETGSDLVLTAIRTHSYNTIASGNAGAAGASLEQAGASGASGDMLNVLDQLDDMPDAQNISNALQTVTPVVDSGVTNISNTSIIQFIGTATQRLEGLFARARQREETGVSTGSKVSNGLEAWGRGFGEAAHQGPRGTSNGYSAVIWGTALGADIPAFNDKVRFGASGGYAQSDVNSKDNSGATDIDSYQSAFYGGYMDANNPFYINGAFSFAYNTYKGKRNIDVGAIRRIANSSYRGQQYSVFFDGGYTFKAKQVNITPVASLQYLRLHLQSYTETGADALNLSVASQNYDMLQSGLGAKLDHSFDTGCGILTPEVHARWLYDFIADKQETTSSFAGGGGSFATQGFDPARNALNVGGRLALVTKGNWSFDANYDFEYKQDFTSHTGWADIRYKF
jgi:autotransporter-associated beta strand protein